MFVGLGKTWDLLLSHTEFQAFWQMLADALGCILIFFHGMLVTKRHLLFFFGE